MLEVRLLRGYVIVPAFISNNAVADAASGVRPGHSLSSGRLLVAFRALSLTRTRPHEGFHSGWNPRRELFSGRCSESEGPRTQGARQGKEQVMIAHVIINKVISIPLALLPVSRSHHFLYRTNTTSPAIALCVNRNPASKKPS